MLPGRYTQHLVRGDQGRARYHLFCAEYCGTEHSGMIGAGRRAWSRASIQAWLSGGQAEGSLASAGRQAVPRSSPATPATGSDAQGRGPVLDGLFGKTRDAAVRRQTVVVDEAYIRESILNPNAKVVGRVPADHADLPGTGQRRAAAAADRVRASAAAPARAAVSAAGCRRAAAGREHTVTGSERPSIRSCRDEPAAPSAAPLPQRRLRRQVVAADARPQAHRPPLPRRASRSSSSSAACSRC